MTNLQIEAWALSALNPYPNNPRTHSQEQVAMLAESVETYGWTMPILIDESGTIIAGHGRLMAAQRLKLDEVPCLVAHDWTEAQKRAYVIADNQLTIAGGWDKEKLSAELGELKALDVDLSQLGFPARELAKLLGPPPEESERLAAADDAKAEAPQRTEPGDVWRLGPHRVLCGDSTDPNAVARLFEIDGARADLVHADPPYGMGKEAEGVANDNLYAEKLDAFQRQWIAVALTFAEDNAGLYIWGNAPDLWRLWYEGGLSKLDELHVRNEIVWAKGSGIGMGSGLAHGYPPETERCLFLMRGQQFLGNQNKDAYWEGYEPLRLWLCAQRDLVGWTAGDINRITGTNMAGHWFGKSQFAVISRKHYEALRAEGFGVAFVLTYDELQEQFAQVWEGGNAHVRGLSAALRESRSYFDGTHDAMTDVWRFGRVIGEERFGHATPKPVAMIARALKTSCPEEGLVFEPFLGTGSTLMAAELTNRVCYGAELEPRYVDVIVSRWEAETGQTAELER